MRRFAIAAFALTLVSCRSVQQSEQASLVKDDEAQRRPVVFVVSGGFSSCGSVDADQRRDGAWRTWGNPGAMDMIRALDPVRDQYKQQFGHDSAFVISCYNGKSSDYIYFFSSADRKLRYTKWRELNPIYDEVNRFSTTHDVIVVGHSYGGWLAMNVAKNINVERRRALFTIDPISPNNCAQFSYARGAAASTFGGSGVQGCTEFPGDLDTNFTGAIKAAFGRWNHFYQTQYGPIHSNVLNNTGDGGNVDVKNGGNGMRISFGSGGWFGGAHTEIDTHRDVWDRVKDAAGVGNRLTGETSFSLSDGPEDMEPIIDPASLPADDQTKPEEQVAAPVP